MFTMKCDQLLDNIVSTPAAGMLEHAAPRHHPVRDPTEACRHFYMRLLRGFARLTPLLGPIPEVLVARDQVVGDREDRLAEVAVGPAQQRAVGAVHRITLVPRGHQ